MNAPTQTRFVLERPAVDCDHCSGDLLKVRKRIVSGGGAQFRWQCQRCGECKGNALPQAPILEHYGEPPLFDDALVERWELEQRLDRDARLADSREAQARRKAEWDEWYAAYLETPRWAAKRKAVMARAGGRCEGCGRHPATEVHHLTYANAGDELLFQLVALCDWCHDKAHNPKPWMEIDPYQPQAPA